MIDTSSPGIEQSIQGTYGSLSGLVMARFTQNPLAVSLRLKADRICSHDPVFLKTESG